jgi:uncharacterized membrane protein YbhN (UPF0104 family)
VINLSKFNKIKYFINILILCLISYLLYSELKSSFSNLGNYLSNINYKYFFLSILFLLISKLIGSYFMLMIFSLKKKINFYYWNLILFNGHFLDYLPFLGFFYKAKKLKTDHKFKYSNYLSSYFFIAVIDFLTMLPLLILFLFIFRKNYINIEFTFLILLLLVFISILLYIFLFNKKAFNILKKSKNFYFKKIRYFYLNFSSFHKKVFIINFFFIKSFFLNFTAHLFNFFSFFLIFKGFNIVINFLDLILIYFIFNIATVIKILPKNYGIDEYFGSYLIKKSTNYFASGFVVMLSLRILNLISSIILFLLFNFLNIVKDKKKYFFNNH